MTGDDRQKEIDQQGQAEPQQQLAANYHAFRNGYNTEGEAVAADVVQAVQSTIANIATGNDGATDNTLMAASQVYSDKGNSVILGTSELDVIKVAEDGKSVQIVDKTFDINDAPDNELIVMGNGGGLEATGSNRNETIVGSNNNDT